VGAVHVASSAPAAAGIVAKTIPARTSPGTRSHRLSAMSVIPLAEDHRVPEGDYHPSFGSPATTMLTRGFASPPCDGFALVERGLPVGIFCAGKMPEWIDSRQCVVTICDRGKCSSCDARESDTNECHSARQRTWGSATLLVAFDNPPSNLNLNFEKQADSARCALSPFAAERSRLVPSRPSSFHDIDEHSSRFGRVADIESPRRYRRVRMQARTLQPGRGETCHDARIWRRVIGRSPYQGNE
jgi:hypothetical protein